MTDLITQPVLYIFGILFSIIAFIGKDLIRKLEEVRKEINQMDKHLSVIVEKLKYQEIQVIHIKEKLEYHDKEINKLREKCHEIGNLASAFQLGLLDKDKK